MLEGIYGKLRGISVTNRLRGRILDVVFPRTCVRCGSYLLNRESVFTCRECFSHYPLIREPVCGRCGVPFFGKVAVQRECAGCLENPPAFVRARSLFLYRDTGARVVHCLKYERGNWLQPEISRLIRLDRRWHDYFRDSVLIPVPLHFQKAHARGYNQAEIVCRAIREAVPSASLADCLQRTRATPSQTFLSREERRKNVEGAFVCRNPPALGGRLIVVDDVLTTGATLNAAIQSLKKAGAGAIYAFTLAHG